jgi:hypothetical protein
MKSAKTCVLVSLGALLVACSGTDLAGSGEMDAEVGDLGEGIVRATEEDGHNQTVMVYTKFVASNGGIGTRTCSGTYFAERVVLTAAHCLENIFAGQVFVYFGDDFPTDFAAEVTAEGSTLIVPPPGEASHFSKADTFEQHPDWDADLVYPDLGLVFLDRKLPFHPIAPARFHLGNAWVNKKVTIEGWGANEATGPTTAIGARVLRTGRTTFLGSPTEADYHEDDPNPGMLVPEVRADVIKIDGTAPNSNACFGDSGGPMYVKWFGRTYLAGTEYWGGFFCEDYSLFTRVSPFLDYLDDAKHRGGHAALKPHLDCVEANADGTFTAFFGYQNDNAVNITIPHGGRNKLAQDTEGFRPTKFLPGEHDFAFAVDFTRHQTLNYKLDPPDARKTELRVNRFSPRCGADDAVGVECGKYCQSTLRSGCEGGLPSFDECMLACRDNIQFTADVFPDCVEEDQAVTECNTNTEPGADNWSCTPGFLPFANECFDEFDTLINCFYGL